MVDAMVVQSLEQDGRTNELAKEKSMSMETVANWWNTTYLLTKDGSRLGNKHPPRHILDNRS
jgi:hypothetical protein